MKPTASLILAFVFATNSFAAPLISIPRSCKNPSIEEVRIKLRQDSAEIPEPLLKPKPVVPLGCDRPFIYKTEVYSADSPQAQDASTLKYFMEPVPDAASILNEYQNNREKSRISGYTGTFGGLLLLFAPALSRSFFPSSAQRTAYTALHVTGAALLLGGFFYTFSLLRANESLIPKAVETFNNSKKDDPIELRFTTGWKF